MKGIQMAELGTTEDGYPIVAVGIEIPGIAGGLRDAMRVNPQRFRQGDAITIAVAGNVQKYRFEPIDKDIPTGPQRIVYILKADTATPIESATVTKELEKHKAQVALAKDEARGQERLQHDGELTLEHFAGKHKDRVKGCPDCDKEVRLEKSEAKKDAAEKKASRKDSNVTDIGDAKKTATE